MISPTIIARFISPRGAARAFWAAMFCLHAPAFVGVLTSGDDAASCLGRCFVLLPTQLFFILKLLDVSWLRLPRGRRALTAFCVVVLLLHARVMTNAVGQLDDIGAIGHPTAALLAGSLGATILTRTASITVRTRLSARRDRTRLSRIWHHTCELITAALLPPRFQLLAHRCAIDRAPPA